MPTISVIMGIFNCRTTLGTAIESILAQTYSDWEMIICDDGSNDGSYDLASEYAKRYPHQIKVLKNPANLGLNATLNRCLELARGKYVARQDGDDISLPQRFAKEVELLEKNPQLAVVSTAMIHFDEDGEWAVNRYVPEPDVDDLMRKTPFAHASSMIRRDALLEVNGYSVATKLMRVEDYHLWYKMYRLNKKGQNIQEPYYKCQDDRAAYRRRKFRYRWNEAYVKWLIFWHLPVSFRLLPYLIKPLLVGVLPQAVYQKLHRMQLKRP